MFSGSVHVGFLLALQFDHGDFEPDCVGVSTKGGGLMRGIKILPQDFPLKMQGGLMREGGGVFAGHYGTAQPLSLKCDAIYSCYYR